MNKTKLEIYALIVCAVSMLFMLVPFTNGIYQGVRLSKPEMTLGTGWYEILNNNDSYWDYLYKLKYGTNSKEFEKQKVRPTESELDKGRSDLRKLECQKERVDARQTLLNNFIEFIIGLIVFIFHWILAKRVRQSPA